MKTKVLLFFFAVILISCNSEDIKTGQDAKSQVLMLKVDYTTNTFEGGAILGYTKKTDNFTINYEYKEPGDFGHIKLYYKELKQRLFAGTIIWMGKGEMIFPEKLEPANNFEIDPLKNYILPKNGFEDVFNPNNRNLDYEKPWSTIQNLVKVREFLAANPTQKAKLFLYTPSVGEGNPKDWYWVIYLKK